MHRILILAASCLVVSAASAGLMSLADRPAAPPSTSSAPAAPAAPASSAAADAAAARHAKRTACLKNARQKKLVGPKRTNFLKECMGPS